MKNVLHITSSPRTEASISRKLGNAVVEKIKGKYPDGVVKERDLAKNPLPHLDEVLINAFFTPTESLSSEQSKAIKPSDEAIAELKEADIIVIDAPMYNFSIPSTLKAYIDYISRPGQTFRYTENGPEGMLNDKKMYIAFSGGGIYSEGLYQAYDFNVPYLKAVFGVFGITDVTVFRAEGLNIRVIQDTALQNGIESIVID